MNEIGHGDLMRIYNALKEKPFNPDDQLEKQRQKLLKLVMDKIEKIVKTEKEDDKSLE